MSNSDQIDICAVKGCKCHLNKEYAKCHPSIANGFLCSTHEHMHVEHLSMQDYMAAAYLNQSKQSEPVVIHEIPARAHKMSMWTSEGYARLEQDLGLSRREFEQSFEDVFGGES